jgi:hypothetical protein
MISADIVKVFDLVNSNDPVLAGKTFLNRIEDRSNFWQSSTTDTILSLSRREKGVIVVVGHLIPKEHISCA